MYNNPLDFVLKYKASIFNSVFFNDDFCIVSWIFFENSLSYLETLIMFFRD